MDPFMGEAISEARLGVENRDGGPFGAVIVCNGAIVGRGHNKVIGTNDPTAHAEINAIREACKNLGKFDLSDYSLYTTCEPCPMCYAAIHWARITDVYYGCDRYDAANIGFDDKILYDILPRQDDLASVKLTQLERDSCLEVFKLYEMDEKRTLY
ncbi:MAG TPA: nucleoside deaminase [Gudongella oleilytica]|nr:nucleoside deaminase [Gudongella oleilytica]